MNLFNTPNRSKAVISKGLIPLVLLLSLGVSLSSCTGGGDDAVKHVSAREFSKLTQEVEGAVVVDVRTPGEFQAGHLQDALLVPVGQLETLAARAMPDKSKPYLVYCRTGRRSEVAVDMLKRMGYTNVTNMLGGIVAWSGQGLPLVRN